MLSSPLVTKVILEVSGYRVSATQRLSILKPLALNRPEILERTPDSLSTSIEIVCLKYISSNLISKHKEIKNV